MFETEKKRGTASRRGGFTLPELLIVVAIIAVLVAITIPVFNSQLHKSRVAADWANVRAYFAELQLDYIQTGKIDDSKLREPGMSGTGYTELNLTGQLIKLETGELWIRSDGSKGYNFLYECSDFHSDCELILPND